ncbi:MAG: hypothetical protein E6G60_05355 [Actinobacteria bacterium]|nr:MAG: hypothetical protein E6G60_05355 [Actinomycetota bacterium]
MSESDGSGVATLLELQEQDLALDRLRHRRESLPERAVLAEHERTLAGARPRVAGLRERRDEVAREERRHEDEAQAVAAQATAVERKLYSGEITSPRELQAMQSDIDSLRRHQRTIEERAIEAMERREPIETELEALQAMLAARESDANAARAALAESEADIDIEIEAARAARRKMADGIDEKLLTEYEQRRARARGVGAARLVGNTCQGCHLSIPAIEADRIRRAPPGTIASCDNCGCILVVT